MAGPTKESMVNCHPYASVTHTSWICPDEHGLIVGRKLAPKLSLWEMSNYNDVDKQVLHNITVCQIKNHPLLLKT